MSKTLVPGRPDAVTVCAVPSASFRLLPNGQMDACCINESVWLGSYPERSLRDAWQHPKLQRLREALARADFRQGCGDCGRAYRSGHRHLTHAESFDRFLADPVPEFPRVLELSLSNRCNLACTMCSGDVSSRIRAEREHLPPLVSPYDDAFFEQLAEFLPHLESAFFAGGEPFLARHNDRVWDLMAPLGNDPHVGVTTNGTVFNDRVAHHVRQLRMRVSVSMDGLTAATNEAIRSGVDHDELLANLARFRALGEDVGQPVRVNFALQRGNRHELAPFLAWAEAEGIDVWLSVVRHPAPSSLLTLPVVERREVLERWRAEERSVAHLEVNRKSWEAAIAAVADSLPRERALRLPLPRRRARASAS